MSGQANGAVHTCALCGARYAEGRPGCASCPLQMGCKTVCCPNCGYTTPSESHVVNWIRRIFPRSAEQRR